VVSWEIALAAVLLVHRQPWQVLVPVVAAAALLVGVTALRVRGRWVHEWISVWLRFRTRRRRMIVTPDQPDGATQVLDVLSRGARMDVLDLEDERAALIISATGLAVVLEPVHQEPGRMIDTRVVLPSLSTLLAPGESDDPELTAQIVVQTVPAPGLIGEDDPAALSYRELAGGTVPARRRCWIALQAPFTPEDVDDAAQRALLVTGVHRVRRRLRRAGLSARVLDPDEALADLLALTGMPVLPGAAPVAPPAGGVSAREGWSTWRAGETLHSSYRVLDWPDLGRPEGRAFLDRLTSSPGLASTLAIAARRRGPEIELEGVLRVTAPTEEVLQRSDRALQSLAQECAARLQPLLGEQNAGLAGSLPLGGFHR
jgi:type VII secretion protein EccE